MATVDDAVDAGQRHPFGLSGSVWGGDAEQAAAVAAGWSAEGRRSIPTWSLAPP